MAYSSLGEHISIRVCDRQQEDIQGFQKGSDGWIGSIIRSKLSRDIDISVSQTPFCQKTHCKILWHCVFVVWFLFCFALFFQT